MDLILIALILVLGFFMLFYKDKATKAEDSKNDYYSDLRIIYDRLCALQNTIKISLDGKQSAEDIDAEIDRITQKFASLKASLYKNGYYLQKVVELELVLFSFELDYLQTKKNLFEHQSILSSVPEKDLQIQSVNSKIKTLLELISAEETKKANLIKKITKGEIDQLGALVAIEATPADDLLCNAASNISAFPYMAKLISEYKTLDLKRIAESLDWGNSIERAKKVASLRDLRKETKSLLEQYKIYEYQLHYLLELFPALKDILDTDYNELPTTLNLNNIEHDRTRDFLSPSEWSSLTPQERNQLALDRYCESHNKSKWQIGRDYELYVGYEFEKKGFSVNYFGSYMGLEDLGRDIIAKDKRKTYIVQCKYWSQVKTIHEKHIAQLYGTTMSYCIENGLKLNIDVIGVFVTNIEFSDMAKKFADQLGIKLVGSLPLGKYPMIKCNIGTDELGSHTKIYHLPFDQQYDAVKIEKHKGELVAFTIEEAETLGFRRAYKWHGEST